MTWIWFDLGGRWLRNPPVPIHEKCIPGQKSKKHANFVIPERYREPFQTVHFGNDAAFAKAAEFGPESKQHFFAIIGLPRKGKSRLCWTVMAEFFLRLKERTATQEAPEVFSWADLVGENDPYKLNRLKTAKFVYLGDAGSTEIYGRSRALVQAALRHRLDKNLWSFVDIDDVRFDEDFCARLKTEAFCVWIDS